MEKLELLAPAKNYKTAICAINSGADAIYIGAPAFGARINAGNKLSDIEKIVNYAHLFNVKVYVTLNTILDDKDVIECEKLINKLYEIKVDAIIIQDFSILQLSKENKLPPIVLHMSTQCAIEDIEKVKFFESINIRRVILARELPVEKIEKIKKQTSIELEHFVFGALCVSHSGQCYLSHYIGQRSANKGSCAQPCRKKYSLINKKGDYILKSKYLLSLKDNNLADHLDRLIKAGVVSFKIEGRLKDELYVKNVTAYFHNKLKDYPRVARGRVIQDFEPDIYKTFNRGFTDDYLFSRKDNIYNFLTPKSMGELIGEVISCADNYFTVRTKCDLNSQDGLCYDLDSELFGCFVNKAEKTKDGFKIYPNKKVRLKKGTIIFRNIDTKFNKILENSKISRKLDVNFVVEPDKLIVYDTELSIKAELPIECDEFALSTEKMKENFVKSLSRTQDSPYFVKNVDFKGEQVPFLPVSRVNELRREILEKLSEKILSQYKVKKQKPVVSAKYPDTQGDYRLNVHNNKALEFYNNCGCEVIEKSFESQKNHKNKILMRTKHCLKKATVGCESPEELFLTDEKNKKYPLEFDCKNCQMLIIAP